MLGKEISHYNYAGTQEPPHLRCLEMACLCIRTTCFRDLLFVALLSYQLESLKTGLLLSKRHSLIYWLSSCMSENEFDVL